MIEREGPHGLSLFVRHFRRSYNERKVRYE